MRATLAGRLSPPPPGGLQSKCFLPAGLTDITSCTVVFVADGAAPLAFFSPPAPGDDDGDDPREEDEEEEDDDDLATVAPHTSMSRTKSSLVRPWRARRRGCGVANN